ncbi:ATP-binding protein [Streptomyces sp. CC228A]|uniref:ATP-binding protein n=1 Tax=Streptomyces sp. CC228A TaxID=2898186 RepID=UPI0027E44238|nr:ATP-binding protein [Streptomyces sp. CC228A]
MAESAGRARRLVDSALSSWGLGSLVEDAELIVSELVANAVQHGRCERLRVRVWRPSRTRVRIAVSDRSTITPTLRDPDFDDEAGRGLFLVDRVAARWGTDFRRWGKVVWAELLDTEGQ